MIFYLQIISYFVIAYAISLLIFSHKNKFVVFIRKMFLILFVLYGSLNLVSYITKNSVLNAEVIANLFDITAIQIAFTEFFMYSMSLCLVFCLFVIGVIFYEHKFATKILQHRNKNFLKALLLVTLLVSLMPQNNIFVSIKDNVALIKFNKKSFEKSMLALGVNPKDYINKEELVANAGKNIVLIYLESLESNFLDKNLFSKSHDGGGDYSLFKSIINQ